MTCILKNMRESYNFYVDRGFRGFSGRQIFERGSSRITILDQFTRSMRLTGKNSTNSSATRRLEHAVVKAAKSGDQVKEFLYHSES